MHFVKGKVGTAENYFSAGCESQKVIIPRLEMEKCYIAAYDILEFTIRVCKRLS